MRESKEVPIISESDINGIVRGDVGFAGLHTLRSIEEPRISLGGGPPPTPPPLPSAPQSPSTPSGRAPQHYYDPECARMEAWLDEHQDFVHDYFLR